MASTRVCDSELFTSASIFRGLLTIVKPARIASWGMSCIVSDPKYPGGEPLREDCDEAKSNECSTVTTPSCPAPKSGPRMGLDLS